MRRSADFFACVLAKGAAVLVLAGGLAVGGPVGISAPVARAEAAAPPGAEAGRAIWLNATAGSERFLSVMRPARLGAPIDWYAMLGAERRGDLFAVWGALASPDCCVPGAADCPAQSTDETFGFAWCEGDEALHAQVGREGYRDPACDLVDPPLDPEHPHETSEQRQDRCDLRFGTSAGAIGIRKFPNPAFDAKRWEEVGGWQGWSAATDQAGLPLPVDLSVEPPFLIGLACAACHAGPDPENPPADPAVPDWDEIDPLAGNPYSRIAALLGSGLAPDRLEALMVSSARPGTAPLLALPSSRMTPPVAIAAIAAPDARPLFEHEVLRWRPVAACPEDAPAETCWCEPDRGAKCWRKGRQAERVPHLGAGAEDDTGLGPAIQRAYLAMGSCAESCVGGHLDRPSELVPGARGHRQSPVDPAICRADCPSFRAIEDRLGALTDYLSTARPPALWRARGLGGPRDLEIALERAYFSGAVDDGRALYARHCARCHSSQTGTFENAIFGPAGSADAAIDWMGNDQLTPVSEIGTDPGRASRGGFADGELWRAFGSAGGGSGVPAYRNPSLRGIWASAPYLHANAVGPELCPRPSPHAPPPRPAPYVDARGAALADPPACRPFDPSARERYRLFETSMSALLTPLRRRPKLSLTDRVLTLAAGPSSTLFGAELGLRLIVPAGLPEALATSLSLKDLAEDLGLDDAALARKYQAMAGPRLTALSDGLASARALIGRSGRISRIRVMSGLDNTVAAVTGPGEIGIDAGFLQVFYTPGPGRIENAGHRFGESLSAREKRALIAFLATL